MELPEARLFGIQGRKPTHDFLSLYSHSTAQQDPKPSSQGNYPKTHDFLQPLERVENKTSAAKEESADEISSAVPRPPPPALLPASIEHILPGGIGTYSISHMSYNNYNNQRVPKQEAPLFTVAPATSTDRNEEHSNCSSYTTGSGFTLWEESAANKKGKTGKENRVAEKPSKGDSAAKWMLLERSSQSFSNSLSCSQTTGHKNQSLLEMLKSAKDCSQDEELDNEETPILMKESPNSQRGELRVEVDGNSTDQKPNTPRSKHSATEQRRRSKINDRFQMLRELIPHSDQKRDKASFLLEVIEYIHFLQEKVHKYEGSYQGWNRDPLENLMPWRNNQRPAESYADQSHGANSGAGPSPTLLFASKIDEKSITISPTNPGSTQNVESGMSTATTFKATDQHPGLMNKAMPIPFSLQPNFFTHAESGGPGGVMSQLTHGLASDAENNTHQPSLQCQPYSSAAEVTAPTDKVKDRDLNIEGGAISISSMYSKGLLDTLTQALQSSGVDLSMASISVQIELGKQANVRANAPTSGAKVDQVPPRNQSLTRSRVASTEESDQAIKKLKTRRS